MKRLLWVLFFLVSSYLWADTDFAVLRAPDIISDPGVIQKKNSQGEWFISLERRDIIEQDVEDLSPLEVCQAAEVLTGKKWNLETVLFHLDEFRNAIRITFDEKKPVAEPVRYSTRNSESGYP